MGRGAEASSEVSESDRISPADAIARFLGVVLLVVVGYSHLLDVSHKIDEGIWYMVFAFTALIAAAIGLAVALVRARSAEVRLVWAGTALLSACALLGYAISRLLPLPGMADHQGDWLSTYGVIAVLAELGLIGLAPLAMRDLTLRGVRHAPREWMRLAGFLAWLAPAAIAFAANPGAALAHGDEEDETEEAGAAGGSSGEAQSGGAEGAATQGGAEASTAGTSRPAGGHGDPFLGTVELTVALVACFGFLAWAAHNLAARVERPAVRA